VRPVSLRELIPQKIDNSCGLALTLGMALCSGACAPILPSLPSVPSLSRLTDSNVFKPFRLDIAQGNYLTSDSVERVRPGMRRQDVRFVLGSPLLLDPFHPNRWDYIFRFQRGTGESVTRRVTIHFDGDRLNGSRPTRSQAATKPMTRRCRAIGAAEGRGQRAHP